MEAGVCVFRQSVDFRTLRLRVGEWPARRRAARWARRHGLSGPAAAIRDPLARSLEDVSPHPLPSSGVEERRVETTSMSQRTVEQVIGKLVTDEGFRRRFAEDPRAAIEEVARWGCELNACEWRALLRIDTRRFDRLAEAVDPQLLKADLSGGIS